jgi:hypothetical protein
MEPEPRIRGLRPGKPDLQPQLTARSTGAPDCSDDGLPLCFADVAFQAIGHGAIRWRRSVLS